MKKEVTNGSLAHERGPGRFSIGKLLFLLIGLGIIFAIGVCILYCLPKVIKYRLTLEVEMNGTVQTGSGVIEERWYNQIYFKDLANGIPWVVHTRGEAVTVDLGSRGSLFALLTGPERKSRGSSQTYFSPDPQQVLLTQLSPVGQGRITPDILEQLSRRRDIVKIPVEGLPMLVRFRDISDPTSVEEVNPDDLAASFGPGIKLRGATIAISDEPVTVGIEEKLRWLKVLNGGYLAGKHFPIKGPAGMYYAGMFQQK